MTITAFPLAWPLHKPRTDHWRIERSAFDRKRSLASARDLLVNEIKLLRGTDLIVSSNIPLRLDGLPRSGYAAPRDAGVAICFKRDKQDMAFACDRWDRVEDNIYAIAKTIDALRGVARWGTGDMLKAAFTGFTALPPPIVAGMARPWWEVLGVPQDAGRQAIDAAWRRLSSQHHPDKGGTAERMAEINTARDAALKERT
ncbi:chaperone protein DnaJ [Variovorax sp. PBL-H6]|uniref:J domain-containing protein n=1 Tax=Variovorax sp. PBL-H6 TaxID=434009 RepID=UPI0013193324|nr:J domain-containing protein [Variovorax sp. PBL-H6]VTU28842.1 chaperone protein DnaJ [Variovorax sp. PBL-H6]